MVRNIFQGKNDSYMAETSPTPDSSYFKSWHYQVQGLQTSGGESKRKTLAKMNGKSVRSYAECRNFHNVGILAVINYFSESKFKLESTVLILCMLSSDSVDIFLREKEMFTLGKKKLSKNKNSFVDQNFFTYYLDNYMNITLPMESQLFHV